MALSRTLSIGVVVTVVLVAPTAVIAQLPTVSFGIQLHPGDAFFYTVTTSAEVTVNIAGTRQSSTSQLSFRESHRVLEVDPQGVALVEVVLEDIRIVRGALSGVHPDSPVLIRVLPNGSVAEHLYGELEFGVIANDYLLPLPDHPVAPGDSWTREGALERFGATGQGTTTYTLVDVTRVGDAGVARIRSQTTATITTANMGPQSPDAQVHVQGTIHGTGESEWLIDPGRLLRSSDTLAIDIHIEGTEQGRPLKVQFAAKGSVSSTPLLGRDLPQVVAPAESLITPAQGIGMSTLTMSVDDLTNRLGQPESQDAGAASRVPLLEWPGGLVGFVDPADSTRLLGLKVADRQYRTEKGIGVGSSMGAAVLAYGLSPKSINLSSVVIGAKILAYDDLGIAFGIAIATETNRPPLGAVDWVAVFAPGSASRIFPPF